MAFLENCRFCLKSLDPTLRIRLNAKIKKQFKELTNSELKRSQDFPEFSCQDCLDSLNNCLTTRNEFLEKQEALYKSLENVTKPRTRRKTKKDLIEENDSVQHSVFIKQEPFVEIRNLNLDNPMENNETIEISNRRRSSSCKKFKCQECNAQVADLKLHNDLIHLKLKNVFCDICNKGFYYKNKLKIHLKRHFNIRDISCLECNKLFVSKTNMMAHIKFIHRGIKYVKSITCELCGKNYSSKTLFNNHLRSKHTGERPFLCNIENCSKSFFTSNELCRHKRFYHSDPTECPICHLKVKRLKSHMISLHEERKFICDHEVDGKACLKKYDTNAKLKRHVDIAHRGIREFACTLCNSVFSKIVHLDNHRRNVHENRRIKCEICKTLVTKKEYYRRHVLLHHKELDETTKNALLEKIKRTAYEDLFNHQL